MSSNEAGDAAIWDFCLRAWMQAGEQDAWTRLRAVAVIEQGLPLGRLES